MVVRPAVLLVVRTAGTLPGNDRDWAVRSIPHCTRTHRRANIDTMLASVVGTSNTCHGTPVGESADIR